MEFSKVRDDLSEPTTFINSARRRLSLIVSHFFWLCAILAPYTLGDEFSQPGFDSSGLSGARLLFLAQRYIFPAV